MTKKERVRKYGGRFNIHEGYSWTKSTDLQVHLALTPKVGSPNINIATGRHAPGMEFEPHRHPLSEEVLIVFRGKGQCYLYDKWLDVEEGDIIYAPAGVWHGTRNPATNTEEFITLGIASPPQLDLYQRAGLDLLEPDTDDNQPDGPVME